MQHNQPAQSENIFSNEYVRLRPMDNGQSLACRKPDDRIKIVGSLAVGAAAGLILISLGSLATGIPPDFLARQGAGGQGPRPRSVEHATKEEWGQRSGTEPSAGSHGLRIVLREVLGREPIVLELPESAAVLVVGLPVLIFGVLILGSVDDLTIDLKQRTYRRRRGFLRWTKSAEGTLADFAGLRSPSTRGSSRDTGASPWCGATASIRSIALLRGSPGPPALALPSEP
jgi:hypothetical protein